MNAIILVRGEKSKRLKREKSSIMLCGKTILGITIEKLSDLFQKIFIVSNQPEKFASCVSEKVEIIKDDIGCGPLGGIYTGLKSSPSKWNFVVACDLPFISKEFILYMVGKVSFEYDAIVPEYNGYNEVLHSCYNKRILSIAGGMIEQKQYQIKKLLSKINVKYIKNDEIMLFGNPEHLFFNINTEKDLKKAMEISRKCPQFLF